MVTLRSHAAACARRLAALLLPALLAMPARAADYDDLSLEELLNVDLTVASRRALSARESPGIVTLLTREELRRAGVRDLVDALRLVPGFSFGVDVQGVAGAGVRGFWAHEGKVALFIDGVEMNEALYSTLQFGHHYPVELIEKIEIIRGPGSAVYGGTAELAVIQVTTRGPEIAGWEAGLAWSQGRGTWMRRRASLAAGGESGGVTWSIGAAGGQGRRAAADYVDIYGTTLDMTEESRLDPLLLNLGLTWKRWSLRALADRLHTTQGDQYVASLPAGSDTDFLNRAVSLQYKAEPRPGLALTPYLRWRWQNPWRMTRDTPFDKEVSRLTEGLVVDWEPSEALSVTAGVELYQETTTDNNYDPAGSTLYDPDHPGTPVESVEYQDLAVFAQAQWLNPVANLTVGARWEDHSQTGGAFVPRVALTRLFERVHVKLLAARAFRAPAVMNISLNPDIKPETATVLEAEAGWQADDKTFVTANVFDIVIRDPTSYFYDETTDSEHYFNFDRTARRGLELELRRVEAWGRLTARAALARPADGDVPFFQVPGEEGWMLGLPRETASLLAGIRLRDDLTLTPGLAWLGERRALTALDGDGDAVVTTLDAVALLNLALDWREAFGVAGLELNLALHDALDEAPAFAQPYDSWHAPLPGPGRELALSLRYGGAWR